MMSNGLIIERNICAAAMVVVVSWQAMYSFSLYRRKINGTASAFKVFFRTNDNLMDANDK